MRTQLPISADAPQWAHDMADMLVREFDRVEERSYPGPRISKSAFVDRMTDDECDTFDTMLDAVSSRERLKWGAVSSIYLRSPDYPSFRKELEDQFTVARAAELLLPTD